MRLSSPFFASLVVASVGCSSPPAERAASGEDAIASVSARVEGNANGWAYLRYAPHGPAFDYLHKGTSLKVSGKWSKSGRYVCAKAEGRRWGWVIVDNGEVSVDWSSVPNGKGACEYGDTGDTSVLYWNCHVKGAVHLRYQASPTGEVIERLEAHQAVALASDAHCGAQEEKNGFVWVDDIAPGDGNNCRSPGPGNKGWIPAEELECSDPSADAVAGISGCTPSDGCHSKYAHAPYDDGASSRGAPTPATPDAPLYRYWNATGQDHFYTVDRNDEGYAYYGYAVETTEGKVFREKQPGTVPLYRLWNPGNVDHFYTTSADEEASAEGLGYVLERVEGYVFPGPTGGTVPLHRYWNAGAGDHFFTIDRADAGYAQFGYAYEGVAGFVGPR